LKINTEVFQISLRYGPPRKNCEDRLKRSELTTLKSRRYNWSRQNYQWERSTTAGEVLFISTNSQARQHGDTGRPI